MSKKIGQFSIELKKQVTLAMLKGEQTIAEIAKQYKVHPNQLYKWKKQALANFAKLFETTDTDREKQVEQEISELERKIGQLTLECDFLKKNCQLLEPRRGKKC